jgi:hypothetical protein
MLRRPAQSAVWSGMNAVRRRGRPVQGLSSGLARLRPLRRFSEIVPGLRPLQSGARRGLAASL